MFYPIGEIFGLALRPHSVAIDTVRPRPLALGLTRIAPLAPHSS